MKDSTLPCGAGIIIPNLLEEKVKHKQAGWLVQGPTSVWKRLDLNRTICRAHRLVLFLNCCTCLCYPPPQELVGGRTLERGPVRNEQECSSMLFPESWIDRSIILLEPEVPQLLERLSCPQLLEWAGNTSLHETRWSGVIRVTRAWPE